MIIKVFNSAASFTAPFFYNINKIESGEAELICVENIDDASFGTMYRTLLYREALKKRTKNTGVHITMSADKTAAESLTDSEATELLRTELKEVGLGDQPYLIVRHEDTDNVHFHVVSTKIKEDGRSVVWNGIGRRLVHELMQHQEEYGYSAGADLHAAKQGILINNRFMKKLVGVLELGEVRSKAELIETMRGKGYELENIISSRNGKPGMVVRPLDETGKPKGRPWFLFGTPFQLIEMLPQIAAVANKNVRFIIHNEMAASMYLPKSSNSPDKKMTAILEAARHMLRSHTWGADIRYACDDNEYYMGFLHGKTCGHVNLNLESARFVSSNSAKFGSILSDATLENPEDVIQFIDTNGNNLNLTADREWRERVAWVRSKAEEEKRKKREEEQRRAKEAKERHDGAAEVKEESMSRRPPVKMKI